MNRHVRIGNNGNDDDEPHGRRWACPFYLANPICHAGCVAYKMGRVADIRQHIQRKHAKEAGKERLEKMQGSNSRGETNVDRWYALWALFFPDLDRPATPYYTGTEFVDLSVGFMSRFMGEWKKGGSMPADVKTVLMEYLAFVKSTSREMKSGRMFVQAVTEVSEHQAQGTEIQDSNTFQGLPLLPNLPSRVTMGPPQQPDPRGFIPGYYGTPTSNVPTQPQTPSMPVANSQYWPHLADSAAYPAVSAHELPPAQSLYATAANGLVDYAVAASNLSGTVHWAPAGDSGDGGDVGQFGFGYDY
ncbi:uncharacterized protein B0H64DRAFT_420535 [Chaetomium fimeti]|uniref:C2H2-type domain-containing protein n=1 Tax=Chaetomium fimeti TaxID=1854472 RepID=A0AAE0LN28_9PEZI|nr:hypothetical protein B0H64DRAFT_420535 [Chaetomium fimeti]